MLSEHKRLFVSLLIMVNVISGCAGADVVLTNPSQTYSPTENVIILFQEPNRPYEVIGIVEGNGGIFNNESQVYRAIQKKAGEIGAHAVIPIASENRYVPPTLTTNPFNNTLLTMPGGTETTIKAVAIRFR